MYSLIVWGLYPSWRTVFVWLFLRSYLKFDGSQKGIDAVLESISIPRLVALLKSDTPFVVLATVRCFFFPVFTSSLTLSTERSEIYVEERIMGYQCFSTMGFSLLSPIFSIIPTVEYRTRSAGSSRIFLQVLNSTFKKFLISV